MKLPDLPSGWNWKRLKYVADLQTGITLGKDYGSRDTTLRPYLRVANVQDGYLDLETITEIAVPESEASRCELRDGDVLMTEGGDFDKLGRGYVWTSQIQGCLHQNHVFAVRPFKGMLNSRFLSAVMTSHHGKAYFTSTSQQTTNLACTNSTKIREFPIPLPSFNTQNWILSQLDRQTAKIDALTQRKERLIALLEEKRAALINRAVTKGLDPNAPMKDSGIPWLASVPRHWDVRKLKFAARLETGHTPSRQVPEYWQDCTIPWVSLADVWRFRGGIADYVEETTEKISALGLANSAARLLPEGTVIFSRTASVGHSAILAQPMATTQDFVNWICGPALVPKYLLYCLRVMTPYLLSLTMGSTHQTIYMPDVERFVVPVPPLAEQRAVVAHMDVVRHRIDTAIAKIREQIGKFQEYRTALISAAVTGKIDVRETAEV
jgi:type I restriction enzyme S subunit